MIRNARQINESLGLENLGYGVVDISKQSPDCSVDFIYTTRCLINLPSWELQLAALRNIATALSAGGMYIMIEHFIEGHDAFNEVRDAFGLPAINIRGHNNFFKRNQLIGAVEKQFDVIDEVNISSSYYIVSRIIYSRICMDNGVDPDYFDDHHKYAAQLPFCGEYGPVRMVCMRRR